MTREKATSFPLHLSYGLDSKFDIYKDCAEALKNKAKVEIVVHYHHSIITNQKVLKINDNLIVPTIILFFGIIINFAHDKITVKLI